MRGVSREPIDWPAIEMAYCTDLLAVRELARKFKVSEGAIRNRIKLERWVRDGAPFEAPELDPEEIVRRGQDLATRMLDELEAQTAKKNQLRALILEAPDSESAAREVFLKATSLGRRAMTLKTLMQAAKLGAEAVPARAQGKKAERQAAAEKVAGRFTTGGPPKLAVDNTKR